MPHVIACIGDDLLFSTAVFANHQHLYDLTLDDLITPQGLLLPSSTSALRDPTVFAGFDASAVRKECPGLMLTQHGLVWHFDNGDDGFVLHRPHPTGGGARWASYDGQIEGDVNSDLVRGLVHGAPALSAVLEAFVKFPYFPTTGYRIWSAAQLCRWLARRRDEPTLTSAQFFATDTPTEPA